MLDSSLKKIVRDTESLELNDLIEIKKIVDEAVAKQRNYDDVLTNRHGAPYYT